MASATNKHMNLQQQNVSYNSVQTLVSIMVGINEAPVVFLQKGDDSSGYLKSLLQPVSFPGLPFNTRDEQEPSRGIVPPRDQNVV